MKYNMKLISASIAALLISSNSLAADTNDWKPSTPPLTLNQIAEDFSLTSVSISPDGKHLAGIAARPDGTPIIKIWEVDDLSKTPVAFASKGEMIFRSVRFVKNDRLWINAMQPAAAGNRSDWYGKVVLTDLEGKFFEEPLSNIGPNRGAIDDPIFESTAKVQLLNRFPKDKQSVILERFGRNFTSDIVKYNVYTGKTETITVLADQESPVEFDRTGKLRVKSEVKVENGKWLVKIFWADDNGKWIEQKPFTTDIEKRQQLGIISISDDAKRAFVATDIDSNFQVIKEYNFETQTFTKTLFQNPEYDSDNIYFWSDKDDEDDITAKDDNIAGYCYYGPSEECYYTHPVLKELDGLLASAFPDKFVNLIKVKKGGNLALVSVTGVDYPTTWYILKDKKNLIKIGSIIEGVDSKNLGKGSWVEIPARDGEKVPSVVTLPPGYDKSKGRIPLVVMPHGGPWSRDDMDYDASHWVQMFATRGFAVIQPNYRGSTQLGRKLWLSGDKQWGAKMQDDKDDAAKWLVEQGIADPNRMMVYGYSYGGFAATAAAARSSTASKGLWQCAIAGGPVIDIDRLRVNEWGENRLQRKYQGQTVDGWNPQKHLNEVVIPFMIFHGDYDHQADVTYSRMAAPKLRTNKATFKYVELPRMSHTLGEMFPAHKKYFNSLILDFMANDCGNISEKFDDSEASKIVSKPFKLEYRMK